MVGLAVLGRAAYGIVVAGLLFVAGLVALSALPIPGSFRLYLVSSGSMGRALPAGSVVAVKPEQVYREGDMITFRDIRDPKLTVTHRVLGVSEEAERALFLTKGDANNSPDREEVPQDRILGKVVFALPYVGYLVGFARTRMGLLLLIIIPAAAIVGCELVNIGREIGKWRAAPQQAT
jgi:signal peptidase